jgi:hypothetical protein
LQKVDDAFDVGDELIADETFDVSSDFNDLVQQFLFQLRVVDLDEMYLVCRVDLAEVFVNRFDLVFLP